MATINVKQIGSLLLLLALALVSCEKEKSYDPITLSHAIAENGDFDNEARLLTLSHTGGWMPPSVFVGLSDARLPLSINGGDGHYIVTNDNEKVVDIKMDGHTMRIKSVIPGSAMVTIQDRSKNTYALQINVTARSVKVSSYAIVYSDDMDAARKAELENRIIADAPKGRWEFTNGKARIYLTDAEGAEYRHYDCVSKSDYQIPILINTQLLSWRLMRSDEEEFLFMIASPPLTLNDGRVVERANSLACDVTHRYIDEYPEIERAYEIQIYQ